MATDLSALSDVSSVNWHIDEENSQFRQELFPYRFVILDQGVSELLLAGEYEQLKQKALLRLYSPLSVGNSGSIDDPFGLFGELGLNRKLALNLKVSNSLFEVMQSELPTYILMVQLADDPFSPRLQHSVLGVIDERKNSLSQSDINISMSGMLIHAEAGARQARSDPLAWPCVADPGQHLPHKSDDPLAQRRTSSLATRHQSALPHRRFPEKHSWKLF